MSDQPPTNDRARASAAAARSPAPPDRLERPPVEHQPRWKQTVSALMANRLAAVSVVVLLLLVLAALLADWIAPYGMNQLIAAPFEPPSSDHLFGTDNLGRDVFSRVLIGSRLSLQVGIAAVAVSLVAGTAIGLVAGYRGGMIDVLLMRFMDIMLAFPVVLLAIAIAGLRARPSLINIMLAIGVVFTPIFARVVRGSVLSVREEVYIRATRSIGASDLRILGRHVLPNVAAPLIVQTSLSLAFAILIEAALSFVGQGAQPPQPAWGQMLQEAQGFMSRAWWMSVFPGLAIFVTVMAFNLVGDGLRDALDPRQRSVIESRGREL